MNDHPNIPTISVQYGQKGTSTKLNERGMRPMQERAFECRGEQYLLIKSPPASGKSMALMFIALDKMHKQGVPQTLVVVPEKTIGSSFNSVKLSERGYEFDWHVEPKWNLCNAPGTDGGKVKSVRAFLESEDRVLVCTHATFRFAVNEFGIEAFDGRLIAVDEFHHVSANPDNILGSQLTQFISRDKVHIVAMTGSYFRGDADAVLSVEDEAKFTTVTYTYFEQLNGYDYLKKLDIGYYFYAGQYADDILKVLDPNEKTIVHIPNVNSRESYTDKVKQVEHILDELGEWLGTDPETGFQLVKTLEGKTLRIADLVDDEPAKREKVAQSLRNRERMEKERDYVDIIIALGMAKEGFDWIWCEHALTVGYRSSLTEIIQIIGRATRDAPGKLSARFTNLIAEPDATEQTVSEAVNDTLKAIAASLLMEQVLVPRYEFVPKYEGSKEEDGFDYGDEGYKPGESNVGYNESTGQIRIEIKGLVEPKSPEAKRICSEDINELITAFVQDTSTVQQGVFDNNLVEEELTQIKMGKIIAERHPDLEQEDVEAIRQHAIAALNLTQVVKEQSAHYGEKEETRNTALVDGVRRYVLSVRDLDIDLIDRINPFGAAYAILSVSMNAQNLERIKEIISAKNAKLTYEEAKDLALRALQWKEERGRLPSINSADPWERRLAEGIAYLARREAENRNG